MDNKDLKRLEEVVPIFAHNKSEMDSIKKLVDRDNKEIKSLMDKMDTDDIDISGFNVKVNTSSRTKLNEKMLIKKLKKLGKNKGVVKRREYVDLEALENAIYTGEVSALDVATCQEVKHVKSLRVKFAKAGK